MMSDLLLGCSGIVDHNFCFCHSSYARLTTAKEQSQSNLSCHFSREDVANSSDSLLLQCCHKCFSFCCSTPPRKIQVPTAAEMIKKAESIGLIGSRAWLTPEEARCC